MNDAGNQKLKHNSGHGHSGYWKQLNVTEAYNRWGTGTVEEV